MPPASGELTARLLSRTELLAATPEPASSRHSAARALALTTGGTAAAVGILAVSAFTLAGDGLPKAQMNASLVQQTAQLPADGRELTDLQLAALRSEGWICPGLESLGFRVQSANAITFNGRPAVEMHLTDGKHYATIVEQPSGDAGPVDGTLHVSNLAPWTATLQTAASTFSVESDLPPEQADDALPVLRKLSVLAREGIDAGISTAPAPPRSAVPDDTPGARLERGIRKIGEMLAP